MEDLVERERIEAVAGLENALEEIKSGEGLSTFVEGHGLQSRRFRFEWHEPSLDISFELPTGRVLSGDEDVKADEDVYEILTAPNDFSSVREALEKQGMTFLSAEVQKIPQNTVSVTDPDTVLKIQKMLDLLEESDDVQNVFHNAELPEEEEED